MSPAWRPQPLWLVSVDVGRSHSCEPGQAGLGNAHPLAERGLWAGLAGDAGPHGAPRSVRLSPASGRRSQGGPHQTQTHEPRSRHLAEEEPLPSGDGVQGAGGLGMSPDQ